jgi:hypothetical protein
MTHIPAKSSLSVLGSKWEIKDKINTTEVQETTNNYLESQKIAKDGLKNLDKF